MSTNTGIIKQPLKILEIPLRKFNDEAIPHHQKLLQTHKHCIQKLVIENNSDQLRKVIKDNKRIIRQLKDLLYELDTLRAQVEDCDLDVFDIKTLSLRKILLQIISEYGVLEKIAYKIINRHDEAIEIEQSQNPFEGAQQIQIHDNLDELKLKDKERTMHRVELLNNDIQGLHEMYTELNQMTGSQAEQVDIVENHVEIANENVNAGLKQLMKASKLKTAVYPATGAVIGGIIGGPIGLIAGLKVGALATLGCGLAGYTGGKLFQKFNVPHTNEELNTTDNSKDQTKQNETVEVTDKKDI